MAAKNPRINISPSDEAHTIVSELSDLTGRSRAGIVNDLLQAALPALRFTIESLNKYRSATTEAEKSALEAMFARTEQGLESMRERVQKRAEEALISAQSGAGTGTGYGDTARDASTASAGGDDAIAGAGTGAGEQGGANANGNS